MAGGKRPFFVRFGSFRLVLVSPDQNEAERVPSFLILMVVVVAVTYE